MKNPLAPLIEPLRRQASLQLAPLQAQFEALPPRERSLVTLAAVALGLLLIYMIVWLPFAHARERNLARLIATQAVATDLEKLAAQVDSGHGPVMAGGSSLLATVDQATKSGVLGKPPSRLQPDGDTQVRVWLEGVPFDALSKWIGELQNRYGIRVDAAEFEREPVSGLVNARLTLVRAS